MAALTLFALAPAAYSHAQAATPRPLITGISHLSVYTADAAKSEDFYVHILGAVKRSDPENSAGSRYYFSPVQFVEVLPLPEGWTSVSRLDHVAFRTKSAEQLRKYLGAHDVAVPEKVESGSDGSRWFSVKDPEGNKVEFVQPPAKPEAVPVNPLSTHIIHVGYMVHNPAKEDAFFRTLLGFRPYWHGGMNDTVTQWISQQVPDGPDWLEYMVVGPPDSTGIPADMTQNRLGVMDHFSLGVFNMEKTVNLLYAGDRLTPRHSPPQIGRDGKWQLNMYDPDGTRAEIMEFQPSVKPCCSEFTAASPTK
ncbi:VOC family protein [Acidipila sp. 4G-K13]|uniref:VOC family protein n=2 Tax=Paracidobacterium acidisoli TaxID=2303751 RepID=A0A372IUR1_9BACT|nr:VOC family protein [Paracidobacterium acidisoli]